MEEDQKLKFKKEALYGIIHGHYLEGSTAEKSHGRLLKMTLVEAMTLEEVKERFEVAAAGEWSLIEGDPTPSPTNLTSLFALDVISDNILQNVDLDDRLTLRKVCRTFRDIVFRKPLTLKKLDIQARGTFTQIISDNFEANYQDIYLQCLVQHGDKRKCVRGNMMNSLAHDAKSILFRKRLTIDEFTTTLDMRYYFQDIEPVFNTNLRLKVRKVKFMPERISDVRFTLSMLDCNFIEEIWIMAGKVSALRSIDIVSQWKLQWKKAKVLISEVGFETKEFMQDFGHFDYLVFMVGNTSLDVPKVQYILMKDLEILKDTLLRRETVQKIEIIPSENHDPADPIFLTAPDSFLPFQDPEDPKKFIFSYPNSEEVLIFQIAFNGIVFTGPGFKNSKVVFDSSRWKNRVEHVVEQ